MHAAPTMSYTQRFNTVGFAFQAKIVARLNVC
jgi:hypothetical protein